MPQETYYRNTDKSYRPIHIYIISLVLSLVLCHGIFDFYEAANIGIASAEFNIFYQLIIIVFATYLYIYPNNCIIIFILLTMYHFGEDYRYILNETQIYKMLGAILIGATALNTQGYNEWHLFIKSLHSPPIICNNSGMKAIINMIKILSIMAVLWIVIYGNGNIKGWICMLALFGISSRSSPTTISMLHMLCIHVPLAAYRIWSCDGYEPILWWICVSVILSIFIFIYEVFIYNMYNMCNDIWYYNVNNMVIRRHITHILSNILSNALYKKMMIIGMLALTIPHIIVTSIWQSLCC